MISAGRAWLGLAIAAAVASSGAGVVGTADAGTPASTSAFVVPLSPCQSSDYTKPSLTDTSVSPTSVDVSAAPVVVTVHADVVDGGAPGTPSGVKVIEVALASDPPGSGVRLDWPNSISTPSSKSSPRSRHATSDVERVHVRPLIVVANPPDSGTLDFRDLAGNAPLHLAW